MTLYEKMVTKMSLTECWRRDFRTSIKRQYLTAPKTVTTKNPCSHSFVCTVVASVVTTRCVLWHLLSQIVVATVFISVVRAVLWHLLSQLVVATVFISAVRAVLWRMLSQIFVATVC